MSFSSGIREELSRLVPEEQDLKIAELSAALCFAGRLREEEGEPVLTISAERVSPVRKYFTLLKKAIKIEDSLFVLKRGSAYTAELNGREPVEEVFGACRLLKREGGRLFLRSRGLLIDDGRRRAFLRGAFLACGTVSDPEKSYHLEFVCPDEEKAELLRSLLQGLGMDPGVVTRKRSEVVYLKGSDDIVDLLGAMGAVSALMKMENVRILKEMRNSVNRQVNCETANLSKTVDASFRQVQDIEYLKEAGALDTLPEPLKEAALVRLANPEIPLKELGGLLPVPVGKSGMNHRLRKLSEYAEQLRGEKKVQLS